MLSFCAAALVSAACDQDYPTTAFLCDPSEGDDACPKDYTCCSSDPTAVDLSDPTAAALPDYAGGSGTPVFSGPANASGRFGRCVDTGSISGVSTIAEGPASGCPMPCNPAWTDGDIASVCGADAFCCPTQELGEKDCVLDPNMGTSGCWRPVTGNDIINLGGLESTNWSSNSHDTHQDPSGSACTSFAEGDSAVRVACIRQLGVASARGLCTAARGETERAAICPLADPAYRDACEQMNDADGLAGCAEAEFP
jgi:hypothetical protein